MVESIVMIFLTRLDKTRLFSREPSLELVGGVGWVATLSLICMNLVSRDDLNNMGGYLGSGDEGAETRAKIWLLISYFMAFGSVAGSVAVLVQCVQAKNNVDVGVGALLQCGFILTAALLFWAFRTEEDSGYGLIY
eukprot:jgi/Botrbrau1/18768/Bobra.0386s0087.3